MTERLYYADPLLVSFDAKVTEVRKAQDGFDIALDRSAFYPTSGGQPFDTGTLTASDGTVFKVTDVECDSDGEVWHRTDAPLPVGACVHGGIDWERRRDHMEQHGGEHMIAGAIWKLLQGVTIGLHCGREDATIDVTLPDGRTRLTEDEITQIEDLVNREIREDAPVHCWFPSEEELPNVPLRKPPAVKEHVRVVAYGNYEYCACGGTHPPSAGWIGCVKILSVLPARGKARVRFVCGERALKVFQQSYAQCRLAADALSCPADNLQLGLEAVQQHRSEQTERLHSLSAALCTILANEAENRAVPLPGGAKFLFLQFPEVDHQLLVSAASAQMEKGNRVVLCVSAQNQFVLASAGVSVSMPAIAKACGLRGGGKPDFVQGRIAGPADETATSVLEALKKAMNG